MAFCVPMLQYAPVNPLAVVPYSYSPPGPPTVQVQQLSCPVTTGNTVTLVCTVTSSLPITYVCWQRNLGGTITTIASTTNICKYFGSNTPSLTIFCVDQNDAGQYTCFASNIVGTGQSLPITLSPPTVQVQQLYPVTTGNTVTLVCTVTSNLPITYVCWQRNLGGTITTINSTTYIYKYTGSTPTTPSLTILCVDLNDAGQYTCFASNIVGTGQSFPIILALHILPSDITCTLQKLGKGHFGEVYLGIIKNMRVAIKTLNKTPADVNSFIKEVHQLTKINHTNIVTFFGICPEKSMMVFEYMQNGDLLNYLRNNGLDAKVFNPTALNVEILSVKQLFLIANQISAGMVYLASHCVVHRDLAARNCLVGINLIVKIGDFGLSRDVYSSGYYRAGNNASLPVRWMAPESLMYGRFTVESDVWSFGVLLWEIFTYGKEPWFGLTDEQAIWNITNGRILNQPNACPNELYEIMKGCWRPNPQDRLKMKEVHERIEQLYFLT